MGNAYSEPVVREKRPLARARRNNYHAYESKFRMVVEKEIQADPEWCGHLTDQTHAILLEYEVALAVKRCVIENCVWSLYANVLQKRTLDFVLLLHLVQRLCKAIDNKELIAEEQLAVFWAAAKNFTEAVLCTIHNSFSHPESVLLDPNQLSASLQCLKLLHTRAPNGIGFLNLWQRIFNAVVTGTDERWKSLINSLEERDIPAGNEVDFIMRNALRICQKVLTDVNRLEKCHVEISRQWPMSPFAIAYMYYDLNLSEVVKPIADYITQSLKSTTQLTEEQMIAMALEASSDPKQAELTQSGATPDLTSGTALFELYVNVQQFHKLSSSLPEQLREQLNLTGFHKSFLKANIHWFDIVIFKTLMRISKAVYLDDFQTVDSIVKYSSSAVDTVTVFYQVKTFWEQLSWPEEEFAMPLAIKILDDVSRCASFYVETIRMKLERLYLSAPLSDQPFVISAKICAAVNSIMHVRQAFPLLANEIGFSVPCDATYCFKSKHAFTHSQTVVTLAENAIDNIDVKLNELFDTLADRVKKELREFFRVAVVPECNSQSMERLRSYISDQLSTLNEHMDKSVAMRFINIFYQFVLHTLMELVQTEIKNNRPPDYFRRWENLVDLIGKSFYLLDVDRAEANGELIDKIWWLLKLHGTDTADLIRQYRLERMKESEKDGGLGSITVRAVFVGGNLNVDVLNARNLKAMDRGGTADPYVKIELLPSHHFPDAAILKTKAQKNTLFPIFDASFSYPIPKEFQTTPERYVLFAVYNKGLMSRDEFMGEAFLRFDQIGQKQTTTKMFKLQQIVLPLTKPSEKALEFLEVLGNRTWDKQARDFVRKERRRSIIS